MAQTILTLKGQIDMLANCSATKLASKRSTNSVEGWPLPLPQQGMLLLCQPTAYCKRQDLTTPDRSLEMQEQLDASCWWITDGTMWNGILPFLAHFLLLFLILLIVPCLINLLPVSPFLKIKINNNNRNPFF